MEGLIEAGEKVMEGEQRQVAFYPRWLRVIPERWVNSASPLRAAVPSEKHLRFVQAIDWFLR
jgi:hypothetical protein